MRLTIAALSMLLFSSCATIFVSKRQKITVNTTNKNTTVYVNREELGTGKSVQGKVERAWTAEVLLKTEGYRDLRTVLVPTHRPWGFWVSQIPNLPFHILFVGSLSTFEKMTPKCLAYPKMISVPAQQKMVMHQHDQKYIDLSNIKLNIRNTKKDVGSWVVDHEDDMQNKIAEFENDRYKEEQKAEAKAAKKAAKKKKKKKKTLEEPEDNKIVYDDTKFSPDLYKVLRTTGFVDTVNRIFSDNNNTLVLEAEINKVYFYLVNVKRDMGPYYRKTKIFLTWYIKNTYNEILDSVVTTQLSEDFVLNSEKKEDINLKTVQDAIELSYLKLHTDPKMAKHLKLTTDLTPSYDLLSLSRPKARVTEKQKAVEASVIIKTDKGHGSGFAITNDGYIVTNYHVVSNRYPDVPQKITVITSDGSEVEAKLVRSNKFRDLALLKTDQKFNCAFNCSNEKSFKALQEVYTIGAPKSIELGQSVSSGVISNERKNNNNNLLQLGMSVNRGNSGGPVFDTNGNLHGVIVSKLFGLNTEGVSFAIPGYLLQDYLKLKFE